MKTTKCLAVIGLSALMTAGNALAADTGYYGYLSAGQSKSDRKAETDNAIINSGVAASALSSSADVTDTAWKLQVGYRFNRNFAVEGGYVDLGKFTYDASATVPSATRQGDVRIDGWNIGLVGYLPFSDSVTGFARLGAFDYKLDYTCAGTGIPCVDPNRTDRDIAPNYGLGLDFNFGKDWFARAEYEVFSNVGEAFNRNGSTGTTSEDVQFASVGVGYRF